MNSVNTNYGASVALQTMNATNRDLSTVQNRISTGQKVNSAADDGAVYSIASAQRSRMAGLTSLQAGIDRAKNVLDVTQTAGSQMADTLVKMKEKAQAVASGGLSAGQIASYVSEFNSLRDSLATMATSATFNGQNLIQTGGANVVVQLNDATTVATMTLTANGLQAGGAALALTTGTTAELTAIDTQLTAVNNAMSTYGAQSKALDTQKEFLGKLADTVEKGIGQMVDADLGRESARLQSLQIKQQLSVQAMSIANQAPGTILSLFR